MEAGKALGALARARYMGGRYGSNSAGDIESVAATTQAAIWSGCTRLFEATFVASGRSARLDVLHLSRSGDWTVDEVTSS